jgi:hypothetical protein
MKSPATLRQGPLQSLSNKIERLADLHTALTDRCNLRRWGS